MADKLSKGEAIKKAEELTDKLAKEEEAIRKARELTDKLAKEEANRIG